MTLSSARCSGETWPDKFASGLLSLIGRTLRSMKRRPRYSDEPLGRLRVVDDFLPPPERLVLREDAVKVTISLSRHSVEFFKAHAARGRVPYQKMIRKLLDDYVRHHERPSRAR